MPTLGRALSRILPLVALGACAVDAPTAARRATPSNIDATAARQVGPIDVSGDIAGAPYRIVVPANWNGTLLMFVHGYRDKADHTGEVDNRNADVAPASALEAPLLASGYALAGTAFKDNGWAINEGIDDVRSLTSYFRDNVARPDRTILWAFSSGSVIGFKSMEQAAGLFDGALVACGVGAGGTRTWDAVGDLALAYHTVFGIPSSWGTFDNVRDDVDFESEVQPKLFGEVSNPVNFPRFEFLRLVAGVPGRGISPPPPPSFFPGWVFTDFFFGFEARAELERRAGGAITQNVDRNYQLTAGEVAYLNGLGLPTPVINAWLAAMNAQRTITGTPSARNYVRQNADYSGKIHGPVLTMHTAVDPLIPVSQEHAYGATVGNAGRVAQLRQAYVNANGHCAFTGPQVLTAVNAINSWVATGIAPGAGAFPGGLGFLPGFVPPAMLQP